MVDGEPTAIANGVRIVGTAEITNNGSLAPFTGSPVVIELTGGSALVFSKSRSAVPRLAITARTRLTVWSA